MNKEEQENMFKMFLNFLDGHGYDNEIPAEYFKTDLFKSNNYYDWLETYQKLTSDHNTCDLSEWIETVNNIKQWNIEYESDDIFYSNDCKYERIIGNCAKCSCQDLRNFPCSVLLCSDTKSFKLVNNESKGKKLYDLDKYKTLNFPEDWFDDERVEKRRKESLLYKINEKVSAMEKEHKRKIEEMQNEFSIKKSLMQLGFLDLFNTRHYLDKREFHINVKKIVLSSGYKIENSNTSYTFTQEDYEKMHIQLPAGYRLIFNSYE